MSTVTTRGKQMPPVLNAMGIACACCGNHDFNFFVIDDNAINAFALPGGFIGVHTGLLEATRSEDELAGVLAHEVSHVTQRHIARAVHSGSRQSMMSMAIGEENLVEVK